MMEFTQRTLHSVLCMYAAMAMLALVVVAERPAMAGSPAAATSKTELPAPEELFERALDAMGGREALEGIKSIQYTAEVEVAELKMEAEAYWAVGGRVLVKQHIPQQGELQAGSDGTTTWVLHPQHGFDLAEREHFRDIFLAAESPRIVLRLESTHDSYETTEAIPFDGELCYAVRLLNEDEEKMRAYFEVESGRLRGTVQSQETPAGLVSRQIVYRHWKEFSALQLFTVVETTQREMRSVLRINEMKINETDDAVFELPEAIEHMKQREQERENQQ